MEKKSRLEELMPEVRQISNTVLRRKTLELWQRALSESSFDDLTEVPGEDYVDNTITLLDHQRAVARMALAAADAFEEIVTDVKFDRDVIIAGALVHDVGKAFEYDPKRAAAWRERPQRTGHPSIRHPIYGVHLGLLVGLPEAVLHVIAAHAGEGSLVRRSLENTLIATIDVLFWDLLAKARTGLTFDDLEKLTLASDVARKASERKVTTRGRAK